MRLWLLRTIHFAASLETILISELNWYFHKVSAINMRVVVWFLPFSAVFTNLFLSSALSDNASGRTRRFLWVTHDRRLIFPPGTVLDLKPTLQIPFLKKEEPPDGIHSDIQISWFFYSKREILLKNRETLLIYHQRKLIWKPCFPWNVVYNLLQ